MYRLADYGKMIADGVRMDAYVRALRRVVTPESVVLDLGSGPGVLSLVACRLGARKVYAVEPDVSIQVGRELAAANGYAARIDFFEKMSTEVVLPESVDVVVSDLRGVLPLFGRHLPSLVDARDRLLRPGGTLIPRQDTLWGAPAEAPAVYERFASPWDGRLLGLDMSAARQVVMNTWIKERLGHEQLLAAPQRWATLDYTTLRGSEVRASPRWTVARAGTVHGLCLWFDAELLPGIGFSNAPGSAEAIYGSAFFPLVEPVPVAPGDVVAAGLRADLVEDAYVWRWDTRVLADDGAVRAAFKQSTFFGAPLSQDRIRRTSASHAPELGRDGEIDRFVLSRMDGQTSLEQIARELAASFSESFSGWADALPLVGKLSQRYGR